jgi:transcriptional regulator with XRE-family HTH domain
MQEELCVVADSIRTLREAKGLTQEQLAEKADISVSHLAKIETYVRTVGMKTYVNLLSAMDISVEEHFTYIGMNCQDILLLEKIWYLFHDCNEKEKVFLLSTIEGIKKGMKEYLAK